MSNSTLQPPVSTSPTVPTTFQTDNGPATPAANILNIFGLNGVTTEGSGNTVTIIGSGVSPSYVNVVGPQTYAVTATDYYISCDSTLGVVTVQLPNAPVNLYDQFIIKDRTGTAPTNNVIVTTVGGVVLIDGLASYTFTDAYESLELIWNGTKYEIF